MQQGTVMPTGFGYVSVPATLDPDAGERALNVWTLELATVAAREGYAFAGVFADVREQTETGLYRLLQVLRSGEGVAVLTRRPVTAQGLLVPADLRRRVEVREVPLTAAALSDLIGGGLLDETMHATIDGHGYAMYVDEDRVERNLPVNDRATILSARLGIVSRAWMQGLRGDILVLGADEDGEDQDIPRVVLDLARVAGLLPSLKPRPADAPC